MKLAFEMIFFAALLSSCASLRRSDQSGYANLPPNEERNSGPSPALPRAMDPQMMSVQKLEGRLETPREKEQYSRVLPWLSEDEKLEFLRIPTVEARQQWIHANEIWRRAQAPTRDQQEAMENNDILVGMPMDYVKKSWGEPQHVEVSGNPLFKNERWKYQKSISSSEGFKQEKRTVYFEGGRVVGWDTEGGRN